MPRVSTDQARADFLCQPCRMAPPAFSKAVAYGVYEGPLRSLIHLLKYDRMQPIAARLGRLLVWSLESLPGADALPEGMLVVPVPMHRGKLRQRGFNHAGLLAQAAIAEVARSGSRRQLRLAAGLLVRRRATVSQAGLTPHQRRRNLRGVFFAPRPARLAGQHVLLVDDVYTTGATARACSRVLIDAGAASVWVATVGRAQREGVARWDGHFVGGLKSTVAESVQR